MFFEQTKLGQTQNINLKLFGDSIFALKLDGNSIEVVTNMFVGPGSGFGWLVFALFASCPLIVAMQHIAMGYSPGLVDFLRFRITNGRFFSSEGK